MRVRFSTGASLICAAFFAWRTSAQEWSIRFEVSLRDSSSGKTFTDSATAQVKTGATDGFDGVALDVPEPPPPPMGLRCYFIPTTGGDWPVGVDGYDIETKSTVLPVDTPKTWKLTLTAHGGLTGSARLCWTPSNLPTDCYAEVLDSSTGRGYALRTASCLDVEVSPISGRSFLVAVKGGAAPTYTVRGTVRSAGCGRPVPGVNVMLDGSVAGQTGNDGTYQFAGVASGTHTVAPVQTSEAFAPSSRQVTVNMLLPDASGVDFELQDTAAPVVRVLQPGQGAKFPVSHGLPFDVCWSYSETCPSSVEIRFQRVMSATSTQSYLGLTLSRDSLLPGDRQRCDKLTLGCDVPKATPGAVFDIGITMRDESGRVSEVLFKEAVLVVNTYSISGIVLDGCGNPMAKVTVKSGKVSTVTDENGQYTLEGVREGSAKVEPKASGYSFSPSNRKVTVNCANPGATGVNFSAVDKLKPAVTIASPTKAAPATVSPGGSFEIRWQYTETCPKAARLYWKSGKSKTLLAEIPQRELLSGTNAMVTQVTAPSTARLGSTADVQVGVEDMAGNKGSATSESCVKVPKAGSGSRIGTTGVLPTRLTILSVQRFGSRFTVVFALNRSSVVRLRIVSPCGTVLLTARSPVLPGGIRRFAWRPGVEALALCREGCVVELMAVDSDGRISPLVRRTLAAAGLPATWRSRARRATSR